MPRPGSQIVHPHFATSARALGGLLDDRNVTIQERTGARDLFGQPADTWSDLADHVDLDGAVGPMPGRESRRSGDTISIATHAIFLAGYYPDITPAHRAVVDDSEIHDIESVEHSSTQKLTRLNTRIVA